MMKEILTVSVNQMCQQSCFLTDLLQNELHEGNVMLV